MSMRREPVLFAVVVALAAWMLLGGDTDRRLPARLQPGSFKEHEAAPPPVVPLVEGPSPGFPGRDPFLEPSETSPLPPRELEFAPLARMPVVAPPLPIGNQPAYWADLRMPGGVVEQVALGDPGGRPADEGLNGGSDDIGGVVAAGTQDLDDGDPRDRFDLVRTLTGHRYYGRLLNEDRLGMAAGDVRQDALLEWVNVDSGAVIDPRFVIEATEIDRVELARTLRNEIELAKYRLRGDASSLMAREALITDLLVHAREVAWAAEEALAQADAIIELTGRSADGYRWKARVLRHVGDLEGEYRLYRELPEKLQGSAFQLVGLGRFKARLGLYVEAEADLREAVRQDPTGPRPLAVLGGFLVARGRAEEALPFLARARRNIARVQGADVLAVLARAVHAHLAVGDVGMARDAAGGLPEDGPFVGRAHYLRGCISYAAGDLDAAEQRFRLAAGAGESEALLGLAVTQLRMGAWQTAYAQLRSVVEAEPLQRHLALASIGLLAARTGDPTAGLERVEDAVVVAPRDPYLLYLLGHLRRINGNLEGAEEALWSLLSIDDRCREALLELTLVHLQRAEGSAAVAESLFKAARFVDRLVALELEGGRGVDPRFRDLQGLVHHRDGNLRAARAAFEAAAGESLFCRVGLALVDYKQNRVERARDQLEGVVRRLDIGDPQRAYVERLVRLIDEHAAKVQMRDAFDRDQLGRIWEVQRQNSLRPVVRDDALVFAGRIDRGDEAVRARRSLDRASDFVVAEVTLTPGRLGSQGRIGLRVAVEPPRGSREPTFEVFLGVSAEDGGPFVVLHDGPPSQARSEEDLRAHQPVRIVREGFDPLQPQRLELRVVPREEGSDYLVLVASWNGEEVFRREVQKLRWGGAARQALHVDLQADGRSGTEFDGRFDDFRMVRWRGR